MLHPLPVQVLIDIDYYKNRLQILALRPAPIQVEPTSRCCAIFETNRFHFTFFCNKSLPYCGLVSTADLQINFLAHPGTCGAA
jgi:hypothetical protein